MDHKKKLSSGELEVKYGSNPKDKTKRILLAGTLARKIKNLKNMDLSYKMEAQAPQQVSTMGRRCIWKCDGCGFFCFWFLSSCWSVCMIETSTAGYC